VLAGRLAAWEWATELLEGAGLTLVTADDVGECLQTIGDRDVDMVAVDGGPASGTTAVREIRRFIAAVRESAPSAGIGVFCDHPVNLQEKLLGPRAWIITAHTRLDELQSMLAEVRDARTAFR